MRTLSGDSESSKCNKHSSVRDRGRRRNTRDRGIREKTRGENKAQKKRTEELREKKEKQESLCGALQWLLAVSTLLNAVC